MLLFSYSSVVCFSLYLVIFSLWFILLLLCAHCLYARVLLFTHTHSLGTFWQRWICTSRYWMLSYIVQVFDENVRFTRSWSFSLFDSGILISIVFLLFPDSRCISDSVFIPVLYLYDIMRGCLYVILQWHWFITV